MPPRYPLFSRFGVELEYMIVDARTLQIRPVADRLIRQVSGSVNGDIARGALEWSNELALHVIEFKTGRPARSLRPLAARFQADVNFANTQLAALGARLLPTAMHPWMDPRRESRLWPHDCGEIYRAFNRLFNCHGHGWTNLQATHLNLPFANDAEFARLHAAIRLLLPLLPALAASSPFVDGRRAPWLDMRLAAYRQNCARIPAVTAAVVPESVQSRQEYEARILAPIYRELAPLDPAGILQHEWVNARGAIARFMRYTIEVRVLDVQECPAADLAIAQGFTTVLEQLTQGALSPLSQQQKPRTADLANLLERTAQTGGSARVTSRSLLDALGVRERGAVTVRDLWQHLLHTCAPAHTDWRPWIERILSQGTLSERILRATGPRPSRDRLRQVYRQLATCLELGQAFEPLAPVASRRPAASRLRLLLTCEHATHRIPPRHQAVARRAGSARRTHRGFDPGAQTLAAAFAQTTNAPRLSGQCSRLLVELNRSLGHPQLWSEYSRPLPVTEKCAILETFYLPHHRRVKERIRDLLRAGHIVLHLGVHTFTPALNGHVRELDIGLLFDPKRARESEFCRRWRRRLKQSAPQWRVRFNAPYRGTSDGLIPALRREFPADRYVGLELEVNQAFPLQHPDRWRQLQRDLTASLQHTLAQSPM